MLNKSEFLKLFNQKSEELTGQKASESDIESSYQNYSNASGFFKSPGNLHFYLNDHGKLTWDFEPTFS